MIARWGAATDATSASPSLVYRRFEPVEAPPVIWLTSEKPEDLPGESTARVVIRSANSDPSLDGAVSPEMSERLIAPPKTSVTMAEQLGKLDIATGLDGSSATWARLAARDPGTLPDRGAAPPSPFPYVPDPLAVAGAPHEFRDRRRLDGAEPLSAGRDRGRRPAAVGCRDAHAHRPPSQGACGQGPPELGPAAARPGPHGRLVLDR